MMPRRRGQSSRREGWTAGAPAVLTALVLALLLAAAPAHAGRKLGARVVVDRGFGAPVTGELIAVKADSILLLDDSRVDQSVEVAHIRSVTIPRSSKAAMGGILGFLAGAGAGYLVGYAAAVASGACPDCEAPLQGLGGGFYGCLLGVGLGASIGSAAGRDVVIPLGGLSRPDLAAQLKRLRKYARVAGPL